MVETPDLQFLERRRFPRYPCTGSAEILQSGRPLVRGAVKDLSLGGCYVETAEPLLTGTEVQLRLTIADTTLYIGTKIVAADPQAGMRMDFMVMPPEQGKKLAQIVEKIKVPGFAVLQGERVEPNTVFRITPETAPDILAEIIKRINQRGVLTRQELRDIMKPNR